jgi:3-oxoacyl-[acyl-carrier-protein] synthase III
VKTLIESLGVYLPPRAVSTEDVVRGCASKLRFPLEKFTGIRSRRMAGETEFSIDLAKNAVADCLAGSRYRPQDVDLVIASNISRCDGPRFRITFEPGTAVRLQQMFGFGRALAFDVSSACTGMFTAIWVADAFLKLGLARCALVVSGEYVTHLTRTAQPHIAGFMDPRLACLTLGDAGAAVMLEPAPSEAVGFHDLELFTLGRYASYCVAKSGGDGPAMFTDAIRLTEIAVPPAAMSALEVLQRAGVSVRSLDHVIMHQTSRTTIRDATRLVQSAYPEFSAHVNVVDNLAERGNTASTSHFVALMDEMLRDRIHPGDSVVFGISGSGQTVGTALYTFDDLPDRVRRRRASPDQAPPRAPTPAPSPLADRGRVRVESIGLVPLDGRARPTLELCRIAAEDCLARASRDRNDIGLLIHAGIYRTEGVLEPAIAAMIAGELGINDVFVPPLATRTLAFDVFNGAVGFLQACFVAIQMLRVGRCGAAMVVASEIATDPEVEIVTDSLPCAPLGSAMILGRAEGASGFGRFLFRTFPELCEARAAHGTYESGSPQLFIHGDPRLEEACLARMAEVARELLRLEGLEPSQVKAIFPPQPSGAFVGRFADALGVSPDRCVDVTLPGRDLFTSSAPYALAAARERDLVGAGDVGLIVSAGSGFQVGCALYSF